MAVRLLIAVVAMLVTSACSHPNPVPIAGCALTAYPLRVDAGPRSVAGSNDFESVVRASMSAPAPASRPGVAPTRPSVLILSGGSQHGAFGAGFFTGLPSVPDYKLVTGVSTGALQATFLYLANRPVSADRTYPAYFPTGVQHTNAGDVALAYSISHEGDLLDVGGHGTIGGVVRGSIANFGPLRGVLNGLISPDTLRDVARDYNSNPQLGRRLLVGVTNLHDGAGYAIDLTELASRYAGGAMPYAQARDCYVDALVASSSVPVAALPVSLEAQVDGAITRDLYIDGGARFGVFWSQLGELFETGLDPEVTLIVNGRLMTKPWVDSQGQKQSEWSSISLALRSVTILENQVYRFSVDNVHRYGNANGRLRMSYISGQGLPPALDPDTFTYQGKRCAEWQAEDDLEKPTEFHPRYMRCLVAYGHARGAAMAWNPVR